MEMLLQFDKDLFLMLNGFHGPVGDFLFWALSLKTIWVPLYAVLLYLLYRQYGWKRTVVLLAFVGLLVVMSDQGSGWVKDSVKRLRPSHEPDLAGQVHLVRNYHGGKFGFVSSHAANSMGIALFLGVFLKRTWKPIPWILVAWALLVSYSRIYLGVHYPLDILGGCLLGAIAAISTRMFALQFLKLLQ